MPKVTLHKNGQVHTDEVKPQTNLVVRAGIRQFPYPNLRYECGMGKCSKCACRVVAGAEHLPPPNWKEKKQLGARLEQGYRLACQLWIEHDIELVQDDADAPADANVAAANTGANTGASTGANASSTAPVAAVRAAS